MLTGLFIQKDMHKCKNCGEWFTSNKQSEIYSNEYCDFDCRNGWWHGQQLNRIINIINKLQESQTNLEV